LTGTPPALDVSARHLAAVIEEARVVALLLERCDLARDEVVDLVEYSGDVGRDWAAHVATVTRGVEKSRCMADTRRCGFRVLDPFRPV